MNKNSKLPVIAGAVFVAVIVLIIFVGLSQDTRLKPNPNATFYIEPNPSSQSEIAQTGAPVSSSPDKGRDVVESASATSLVPTDISVNQERKLTCTIHDLLGNPVKSGLILLDKQEHPFYGGELLLESIPAPPFKIEARAKSYQPQTITFDSLALPSIDFVLDYYCDFKVNVFSDASNTILQKPQPGAQVSLYKATQCPRPIAMNQRVFIENSPFEKPVLYNLRFQDDLLEIVQAINLNQFSIELDRKFQKFSKEFITPEVGDRITSIGVYPPPFKTVDKPIYDRAFKYLIPRYSPRDNMLRMIDALSLGLKRLTVERNATSIQMVRNNGRYAIRRLFLPTFSGSEEFVRKEVTNENGICWFRNMTPGLYFVLAKYENQTSLPRPLHPSSAGVNLELSSVGQLSVFTKRKGIDFSYPFGAKCVPDVELKLKSTDDNKARLHLANTKYGRARFENLPFGKYAITANPLNAPELSLVKHEINITYPRQTTHIYFDGWSSHRIEGTVVLKDDETPIEGIPLELYEHIRGSYVFSLKTITDSAGSFSFTDLPKGTYKINYAPEMDKRDYRLFIDDDVHLQSNPPFYYETREASRTPDIVIDDKSVYTVKLEMLHSKKTTFLGTVINEKNIPVPNAIIDFFRMKDNVEHRILSTENVYSDTDGNFAFSIWTEDLEQWKDKVYTGKLAATLYNQAFTQIFQPSPLDEMRGEWGISSSNRSFNMSGSTNLRFTLGEHHDSLQIILKDDLLLTLEGRVLTKDGDIPDGARVYVSDLEANNVEVAGDYYSDDGTFVISGIRPVDSLLYIKYAYTQGGNGEITEYMDEAITITQTQMEEMLSRIKNNEPLMKMEVTLQKSGYLAGKVVDQYGEPIESVSVRPSALLGKYKDSCTKSNGDFHISQLQFGETYSLYVGNKAGTLVELLSNLQPNMDNLILNYPTEQ
jgi:hypothetical protein